MSGLSRHLVVPPWLRTVPKRWHGVMDGESHELPVLKKKTKNVGERCIFDSSKSFYPNFHDMCFGWILVGKEVTPKFSIMMDCWCYFFFVLRCYLRIYVLCRLSRYVSCLEATKKSWDESRFPRRRKRQQISFTWPAFEVVWVGWLDDRTFHAKSGVFGCDGCRKVVLKKSEQNGFDGLHGWKWLIKMHDLPIF